MNDNNKKWFYLLILSLIWGSSYILIKKGLTFSDVAADFKLLSSRN